MLDKWYVTNHPALLHIDQNSWYMENGVYKFVDSLSLHPEQ